MLFNVDRNTKQSILNQYKQDALDYENRKAHERQKKIEEERALLEQAQKQEAQFEDRLKLEKMRRQNEVMGEYKKMLQQTDGKPVRHSKIEDVKINNYGYDPNKNDPIQYLQQMQRNNTFNSGVQNQMTQFGRATSPSQKEKYLINREDHMGNFLTDKVNEGEVKNYFQVQKQNQQMFYKEMLDNQVNLLYIIFFSVKVEESMNSIIKEPEEIVTSLIIKEDLNSHKTLVSY